MRHTDQAHEIARTLLAVPLPRRWAHTQGVARQARTLVPILGTDADLLEAAAWLHDIGYAPRAADTGFHPLDGARYLRDVEHADELLCQLVAHHSCAVMEAEERGLAEELTREFPLTRPDLVDALSYCDMTTGPDGNLVSVESRLDDIRARYGTGHIVTRFINRAAGHLTAAVRLLEQHLRLNIAYSQSSGELCVAASLAG